MMRISNLNVSYGTRILYRDFDLDLTDNETTVILGSSGCGKTTLLNAIAKRYRQSGVSYIFQEPRLIPWCTLEKNIVLVLSRHADSKKDAEKKAGLYLEKVGLERRIHSYPDDLSGGERQRASIARAFSCKTPILLMDEPFQSQDKTTKKQLIGLVKKLQAEEKRTVIAVTHDLGEAAELADRALVIGGSPVRILFDAHASGTTLSKALEDFLS